MSPLIRISQEEKDNLERIRRDLASRAGTSIGIGTRLALSEVIEAYDERGTFVVSPPLLSRRNRGPAHSEEMEADPSSMDELGSARELWQAVLEDMELQLPRPTFETWLEPTEGVSYDDRAFVVEAPNSFAVMWLERRMYSNLQRVLIKVSGRRFELELRAKTPGRPMGRSHSMDQLIDEFFQEGLRRGIHLEVSQSRHGRYVSHPEGFLSFEVQEARNHALRLSVYGQPDQLLSTSNSEASSIPFDLKAERRSYTAFAVKSAEDVVAAWPLIEAGLELRMRKKGGRESTMQASLPQPIRDMPALSTLSLPTGFGRISVIGQIIKNVEPRTALIVTQYAALHVEYQHSLRSAFALPFETYATAEDGPDSPLKDRIDPFLICKAEDLRSGELGAMCDPHNQVDEGTELPGRSHFDLVVFDDYPSLDIPKGALHPQFSRHLLLVGSSRDADLSKTGSGLRLERGIGIQASEESVDLRELAAWRNRFTWGGDGEI